MKITTKKSRLDIDASYGSAENGSFYIHLVNSSCAEEAGCTHDTISIGMPFVRGSMDHDCITIRFDSREDFVRRFFGMMGKEELIILRDRIEEKMKEF